jgi:hypothetical protein
MGQVREENCISIPFTDNIRPSHVIVLCWVLVESHNVLTVTCKEAHMLIWLYLWWALWSEMLVHLVWWYWGVIVIGGTTQRVCGSISVLYRMLFFALSLFHMPGLNRHNLLRLPWNPGGSVHPVHRNKSSCLRLQQQPWEFLHSPKLQVLHAFTCRETPAARLQLEDKLSFKEGAVLGTLTCTWAATVPRDPHHRPSPTVNH